MSGSRGRASAHRHRLLVRWLTALLTATCVLAGLTAPAAADSSADARRRAEHLDRQAQQQAADVAAARAQLSRLAARANAALDAYEQAQAASRTARAALGRAQLELATSQDRVTRAREAISAYASSAYRAGPGLGSFATTWKLLDGASPTEALRGLAMLNAVGDAQARVVADLRVARHQQQERAAEADRTARALVAAEDRQRSAKQKADVAVAGQQQVVRRLDAALDRTQDAAAAARQRAAQLARAERLAAQRAAAARRSLAACRGGNLDGYANGRLPRSALCPLWGAPGDMLRADAARAFNAMSRAYAQHFGAPICVTSSYRSYADQQRVYRERPGFAARPGSSQHGWGRAVDLCGGVQNDGTPQNSWLRMNAGRFSFFHPAWAEKGASSMYEPWHWEYAG